jgi:exoribonuclease-2
MQLDPLRPGAIIEYLQNNQPIIGWVQEVQNSRVRIININQREMKLPAARILPWIGPMTPESLSRSEVLDTLKALHAKRERMLAEVDAMELWELAQGEINRASLPWLCDLLWDEPDIDQTAALGRKLLQTKTHFKFSPPHFEIYSQESVATRLEETRRSQEKERLVGFGQAFLKGLWEASQKGKPLPPDPEPDITEKLKTLLLDSIALRDEKGSETLWKKMVTGIPDIPFLPLLLAQAWGLVPPHYNYLLEQADYIWEDEQWSAPFAADIAAIRDRVQALQEPPECPDAVSIDSASTRDIDDGFRLERTQKGFHLEIILASPSLCWEFDSPLDKAVMHRFSSIYLPEGTSNMLPKKLGTDFFSLHAGQTRPALILDMELDPTGTLTRCTPRQSWVSMSRNLTYDEVEHNLTSPEPEPMLQTASELATMLREGRVKKGAVIMLQPDPVITLTPSGQNPQVCIETKEEDTRAQVLVSEFMILANSAIATWAHEQGLPLIFRTQNITLPQESAGVWSAPCDIYRLIKCMGPSIMEMEPKRHATLAAAAYAPITSPLRRYSDFINSAQIAHFLRTGESKWTKESISSVLPHLSARAQAVGKIQRYRPRYWKYLFFRQQAKNRRWSGEIVEDTHNMVTISLPEEQLFLKAPKAIFGDKVRIGQRFQIRIGKVDPLANELRIAEAWEE